VEVTTCRVESLLIGIEITGVKFFDFINGQTGVAPNGIEVHPVIAIVFG